MSSMFICKYCGCCKYGKKQFLEHSCERYKQKRKNYGKFCLKNTVVGGFHRQLQVG